jgi:hypothetical protein
VLANRCLTRGKLASHLQGSKSGTPMTKQGLNAGTTQVNSGTAQVGSYRLRSA